MTATADRWETAPALHSDHDPIAEQRIGTDLVLAAYQDRRDPQRWYFLAFDNDGNYLSRIATAHPAPSVPEYLWRSSVEAAIALYPQHGGTLRCPCRTTPED